MDGDDKLMALTDNQWKELYTVSIENRKDISWIREKMETHQSQIGECRKDITALQVKDSYIRGKVAYLAVSVTTVCTVIINAFLWAFGCYGGAK